MSLKPLEFKTEDPFTELCKNSDAYYLHSYKDVTYGKNWMRYKMYVSVNNKLVVNTTKGVEDYAFLNLDEYVSNHLKSIKIRTLKADGSVVELDSSLVFKRSSKKERFGDISYPVPAVEPGDTIETSYVYYKNLKESELLNYVNLYSDLPSMNSQYSVKTARDMTVRYKVYNDFPKPKIVVNDSMVYLQFSKDKIEGIVVNDLYCLPCEKPYFYYALENKDSELKTWKDVYNIEFNFLTQPMALDSDRSSYYKRWKRRVLGTAQDSSKYYKFNLLHNEVLNNFTMQPTNEDEFIKSNGYFLKEQRFDPFSIRRFYRQLLEDLEIDYWAVFGREKRLGPIDKHLIRKGEFAHIFFAFENENGHLKFLYPHEDFYMYQINEIPTELYSTEAVLVKPYYNGKKKRKDKFIDRDLELAEVDSVSVSVIDLPEMNSNHNTINQTIYGTVDIEQKTTSFKYRFRVSGGPSTELRSFFSMLDQNEEISDFYDSLTEFEGEDNTIQIDTVFSRTLNRDKPFAYTINGEGTLNNVVTFINDSLVSLSIDKLINHKTLESSSKTSDLSYFLDFSYSDILIFNLKFPCAIEVLGIEDSNINYNADIGEYTFKLKKNQDNQLKVDSYYNIFRSTIPSEKFEDLKLLNEQVKNAKNKRLIIKLKTT
ncbi:DUF3857 domain-containing protein [Winogradskyella helgolandensis]|uniref:DUF3857 domain-containing protein n=1 Tax=Winogradskyella helgolandensis TaxID=2697010 RepID=UPI001FD1A807|nr:DUF3857 domain-containing protein [Winogradskyella helgolandensis]